MCSKVLENSSGSFVSPTAEVNLSRSLCSISVDLDPIACYTRIHGLARAEGADPIYSVALKRFFELFEAYGVRATFFVVGAEAKAPAVQAMLREAVERGHEIANHTLDHPYGLPELDDDECRRQIIEGHQAITEAAGIPCRGFRAPGYNIDSRTMRILVELGYEYDSSIFPCPPYYIAKGAVMSALYLLGRPSGSSMVDHRTLLAPLRPYAPRLDAVHKAVRCSCGGALVELPICVLPGLRFPVIGTSLILAGVTGARALTEIAARAHPEHLNLEFHGIDLVDGANDPVPSELVQQQPDLKRSFAKKYAAIEAALQVAQRRYTFVPLQEAARRFCR